MFLLNYLHSAFSLLAHSMNQHEVLSQWEKLLLLPNILDMEYKIPEVFKKTHVEASKWALHEKHLDSSFHCQSCSSVGSVNNHRLLQCLQLCTIFWLCHKKLCSFGWRMLFDRVLFTCMQNLLISMVVSIPACHAVAWGLIPWRGVSAFRGGHCSKEVRFHCTLCERQMEVSSSSEHLLLCLCHK